jgi:fatty acid desaturase
MMLTRISEIIHEWMGWCPNSHALKVRTPHNGNINVSADVAGRDVPQPGDAPVVKSGFMDGFTAIAVVIVFATLGFGGLFWWPFFVGAVLVAGLVYWYFHELKRVC